MDIVSMFLIVDSVVLIIATFVLTYFFFKDLLKDKK